MNFKNHYNCRVCGSTNLVKYIDLGRLPLTNNLCTSITECPDRYPLQVLVCTECWLSQLSIVVDPELLFGNYVYRSSISTTFRSHCLKMAKDLKDEYELTKDGFHIDIASNDGALLKEFKKVIGYNILGIDPAKNMAAICQAREIPTLSYFWSSETARRVLNGFGQADLITATNVIAHVDDLNDFLLGVKLALKPSGVFIVECPYIEPFIKNIEFSTIYQEHLSYMSIHPIDRLCKQHGLALMKVEEQDIHCGSVRLHIGYGERSPCVDDFIRKETDYRTMRPYNSFSETSYRVIDLFRNQINVLKVKGYRIAGFAASAKGNTLLNAAGITCGTMSYIVDETPEKIGKFSPGTHIPIVSMLELKSNPPDYLVILSWNFDKEIISKCREAGYKGSFIMPIPESQIFY